MKNKEKDNICILLGAGASVEQKLPQWDGLVESVIKYFNIDLNVSKDNLVESIAIIEDSRIKDLQKGAINIGCVFSSDDYRFFSRRQIAKATRACLKQNLRNRTLKDVKNDMKLMRIITENVYQRVKEKTITTIITYNFDDYFEFCFKCILEENNELEMYSKYLTSYTIGDEKKHLPSGAKEKTLVNVYHVHGFIPAFDEIFGGELAGINKEIYKNMNKENYDRFLDCGIIFSGNDYNSLMNDKLVDWTNMIQYICYSQLPVSIIGFSLTDANFRILIQRMQKSKQQMKDVMLFFGYNDGDESERKIANTNKETADYILSGLCNEGHLKYKIETFGKCYSEEVDKYLKTFLKKEKFSIKPS